MKKPEAIDSSNVSECKASVTTKATLDKSSKMTE